CRNRRRRGTCRGGGSGGGAGGVAAAGNQGESGNEGTEAFEKHGGLPFVVIDGLGTLPCCFGAVERNDLFFRYVQPFLAQLDGAREHHRIVYGHPVVHLAAVLDRCETLGDDNLLALRNAGLVEVRPVDVGGGRDECFTFPAPHRVAERRGQGSGGRLRLADVNRAAQIVFLDTQHDIVAVAQDFHRQRLLHDQG